jgi:uncharacterized phosphosugar-binding protein
MFETYLELVSKLVLEIKDKQAAEIRKAAELMAETIIKGNVVYTFGSGHSILLAQEIHARAGGLYPIVQIPDPMRGKAEKIEGFGKVLVEYVPFKPGDLIFVISNSGRNPEPIEVALVAKEKGVHVIVMCSMKHSLSVSSRHSSGKKLYELGEMVLDTNAPPGDASMTYKDYPFKVGALSTVMGAVVLNAVVVEAVQVMLERGFEPPVLLSANLDGSEEHNHKVIERYSYLPNLLDL